MCGICGMIVTEGATDGAEAQCRAMQERLSHRGPDQRGFRAFEDGRILLAHTRLSIIDLSDSGRQPLSSEDGTVHAIVNGELYNYVELRERLIERGHVFRSHSDSETLVHLCEELGSDGFAKLRGMYAAAVYDQRTRELCLARDPLGIKPLYLYERPGLIAFASEAQAFRAIEPNPAFSTDGLVDFLFLGAIPAPATHLARVRALQPGQIAVIRQGRLSIRGGAPIGDFCIQAAGSEPQSTPRDTLRDSVRRHLISDAPIGLFLSGGIDSGVIAGLARETTQADIRAVCVSVPGHPMDETRFARLTATKYDVDLAEIPLTQADFETGLDHFLDHMDLPTIDGFNTYIVARAARKAGLKAALSGVGGDEFFGGYPTFSWVPSFKRIGALSGILGQFSRSVASAMLCLAARRSGARRAAELLRRRVDRRVAHLAFRGQYIGSDLEELLRPELRHEARRAFDRYMDALPWAESRSMKSDLAVAGMEIDRYMQPTLLRDADAFSMAHSLEVRTPLVDAEVARAALPHLGRGPRPTDPHPKWLLRQALDTPLPHEVVARKKQGFSFPWQEWMRGRIVSELAGMLRAGGVSDSIVRAGAVERHLSAFASGRSHWRCIWSLFVLLKMTQPQS